MLLANRRILVTGAAGFTGQHLIAKLAEHGAVTIGWSHKGEGDLKAVDIRDRKSVFAALQQAQPTDVVHLAAISSPVHGDVGAMYETNVVGTFNLLDALARLDEPLNSVIVASSAHVYGVPQTERVDEQHPTNPVNAYGRTKLACEFIGRDFMDRLPIMITRPFNYTGVGQTESFFVPKIVKAVASRQAVLRIGNVNVVRDFSDVRRVVDAYSAMLGSPTPGEIYNLCSGVGRALDSLISSAVQIGGWSPELVQAIEVVRNFDIQELIGDPSKLRLRYGVEMGGIERSINDLLTFYRTP